MVVAPHARLAARNLLPCRNVVPSIGPMIHAVQQDAFVIRRGGKIGLLEQSLRYGEPGGKVLPAVFTEIPAQSQKALRADRARRRIHRLKSVERIGET